MVANSRDIYFSYHRRHHWVMSQKCHLHSLGMTQWCCWGLMVKLSGIIIIDTNKSAKFSFVDNSAVLLTPHGKNSSMSLTLHSHYSAVSPASWSHCIYVQVTMYLHTSMFDRVSKFKWLFTVCTCMALCIDVKCTWSCVHMHMHAHQEPANYFFFPVFLLSLLILRWPTTSPRARPVANSVKKQLYAGALSPSQI